MKTYDIGLDIKRIMAILDLSIEEFASNVGLSRVTIYDLLNNKTNYSKEVLEKIYSFAYKERINLNRSKELLFSDNKDNSLLLFHGARGDIIGDIDTHHSIAPNDFGDGFYVGETLLQAASWVANHKESSVYPMYFKDDQNLQKMVFKADLDWLYAVLYYRNAFKDYEPTKDITELIGKIEATDIIIAPIADNEMFKIIDSFARLEITDEACIHAISATNLGIQYVFKSDKACKHLNVLDRLYLCEKEKEDYISQNNIMSMDGVNKARLALVEYRRKGKYFDEIFARKR